MATRDIPSGDELREKYPANSNAAKQERVSYNLPQKTGDDISSSEEKQIKKVTKAKVRKQGLVKRLAMSIVEDSIESAKEKAYQEIIVPGFKSLIFDSATEILDVLLFGGSGEGYKRSNNGRSHSKKGDRVSYSGYYDDKSRRVERGARTYEPDDVIVDTRAEAKEVLDEVDRLIHQYGQASVADFYDTVGITASFTDYQYGWVSIRDASIKPIRDGFMILMPRTVELEK